MPRPSPRDRLVILGHEAETLEVGADVLGGFALAGGAPAAMVGRVEADQVAGDRGDFGKLGFGHAVQPILSTTRAPVQGLLDDEGPLSGAFVLLCARGDLNPHALYGH